MGSDVVVLTDLDRTQTSLAGGKGAHLGELMRIDGVAVPPGFCVTTGAYRRVVGGSPSVAARLDALASVPADDTAAIRVASGEVRRAIEGLTVPAELARSIADALDARDAPAGWAVRSSATAEDLPTASFAGQQDTYLNVRGTEAVLGHVVRCWASLFTERAVTYRLRNGIDHRRVEMAVVVQQMVEPDVAGILFTADPVTGDRTVTSIEASYGLGEALVSGRVNADVVTVRHGDVATRTVGAKQLAVEPAPGGGTREVAVPPERQQRPALTDAQARRLAAIGRRIEAHLGGPQDIEWCLVGDDLVIVQSRPITTLFPIPPADDDGNHVYVSVGHQQMMTDPFKPLGLSFWQMTTPRPMAEAAGRLFVDVTQALASPASREGLIDTLGRSDPLIGDALRRVVERDAFLPTPPEGGPVWAPPGGDGPRPVEADPAIVTELVERSEAAVAEVARDLRTRSGADLLDAIRESNERLRSSQFDPRSLQVIMAGMEAAWWLNDHLHEWLGEKNVADTLTQSVPYNVTSEMGLALLDVADAIRPHPEVVAYLQQVGDDDDVLDGLPALAGGVEARDALVAFLDRYGMRCVGEIDITRPRWAEQPRALVPVILGNVARFEPGEAARRFEQGRREAEDTARDVLARVRALPDGEARAAEVTQMIDRVRTFSGYREHPKYVMVSRYFVYKQALLGEARRLVEAGVLEEAEDIFFLRFDELTDVVRTHKVDRELIEERKEAYASYQALEPPRVLTSDGEAVAASYGRDDVPEGALAGLPVSAGLVEGRARVILDLADAEVEAGDILVTAYTDPSWSPLFVGIAGLVTEVGGLMTHGAVVAREYGLPAVVGVEHATRLIRDGQRIRIHGTEGYVELLA